MVPANYSLNFVSDSPSLPRNWMAFCKDCNLSYEFVVAKVDDNFGKELRKAAPDDDVFISDFGEVIKQINHPVVAIILPQLNVCYRFDWRLTEDKLYTFKELIIFNPDIFPPDENDSPLQTAYRILEKRSELITNQFNAQFGNVDDNPGLKVYGINETIFSERDAMCEILNATATCACDKNEGMPALNDRSIIFIDSLFKRLGMERPAEYSVERNFLLELDDKIIFINHDECDSRASIDSEKMIIDSLREEINAQSPQFKSRLHDKPVYVFQKQSRIIRGADEFQCSELPDATDDYLLRYVGCYIVDVQSQQILIRDHRNGI